jgi:S1-C subfamily serine protease
MFWAIAFLAAVAVFGGGYAVGHAAAEDEAPQVHRGGIVVDGEFPGHFPGGRPGHPGMPPFEAYPVPTAPGDTAEVVEGQGFLGISGVDTPGAVLVVEVLAGSPADEAGIVAGDRVVSFGGRSIESMEQLADLVRGTEPGTEVEMVLGGPGGGRTVTVIVGERPGELVP